MEKSSVEPLIEVGIMTEKIIRFQLLGNYKTDTGNEIFEGQGTAFVEDDKVIFTINGVKFEETNEFCINPVNININRFRLFEVTIGVEFHWQQKEPQEFEGDIKLKNIDGQILVINSIPLERYLKSVISSEMNPLSPLEFLKVHAIISRSWLLAQIIKKQKGKSQPVANLNRKNSEDEFIRWYDREDHQFYDVCADDHCQRYQGISKNQNLSVIQAISETKGIVLTFNEEICDARFSKCCGGASESFENAWQDFHQDYLTKVADNFGSNSTIELDLKNEDNAKNFIISSPSVFCNTNDKELLSKVLKSYDQLTDDFYRWTVEYQQDELAELIKRKSGIDFGEIIDMVPVQRGESSRIVKLKIIGTRKTVVVGKELEIRKWLSNSHLYSSAFVVEKTEYQNNIPGKFILYGAGWGHGVGLCQIGAAVMSTLGYNYKEILLHYFKNTSVAKIY